MTRHDESQGFSPEKTGEIPDTSRKTGPDGDVMRANVSESNSLQTELEARALRANGALNALQYLVANCQDLGGLQGQELGWLMDLVFEETKGTMTGRHALLKPSNDLLSQDIVCR